MDKILATPRPGTFPSTISDYFQRTANSPILGWLFFHFIWCFLLGLVRPQNSHCPLRILHVWWVFLKRHRSRITSRILTLQYLAVMLLSLGAVAFGTSPPWVVVHANTKAFQSNLRIKWLGRQNAGRFIGDEDLVGLAFPQRRTPDALPNAHSQRYFLPQESTPHQQARGISSQHVCWQLRNRTILWSQHFTAANLSLDNQSGETRPACWPIYRSLHQLLVKQPAQLRVTQPATPRQRQFSGMTGDPGLDLTTKSLAEPVHRSISTCFRPQCDSLTRCRIQTDLVHPRSIPRFRTPL